MQTLKISSLRKNPKGGPLSYGHDRAFTDPVNIYAYKKVDRRWRYKSTLNRGRHFPGWRANTQCGFIKDRLHPIELGRRD